MSVDRFVEPWEEMQRQGQDLADRLAQGFTGLLHSHISPPPFAWPSHSKKSFDANLPAAAAEGVSAILDIGNRLGQAGVEFGSCLNGVVHQFFRQLPVPFRHDEGGDSMALLREEIEIRNQGLAVERSGRDLGLVVEQFGESGFLELSEGRGSDDSVDEDWFDSSIHSSRSQGSINFTAKYDSRTGGTESSLVARGDLWRAEASHGGSSSGNANLPLFLVQLGPVLFVRDTTLLLPVHLSKQHLLWYGYDRKNGIHSLCPAIWSKHRRWLLMSMICLNPFACSFLDLQFPNGQLTYVAGEGLTTSAFLPIFGGLLQAQGQYPGETRISFSCKNKRGTRVTPMMQFPDKSFSLGLVQALAWRKSGLMVRPTVQFSVCPTLGGSDPGLRAELIHTVRDGISLIYGGSCAARPSAFALASLGRSKWNTNVGKIGVVVGVETPLGNIGRPSFSIQLNGGAEF